MRRIGRLAWALTLWLVATFFIDANFTATEVVVELDTDATDVARVYFSTDSQWDFRQSSGAILNAGWNRVVFPIPFFDPGAVVRFDPGSHAGIYRIHSVRWLRGGVSQAVRLDALVNAHADINRAVLASNALELSAPANAAQMIVPAPGLIWQVGSLLLPIGLPLIGLLLLGAASRRNVDPMRMASATLGVCAAFYFLYYLANQSHLPDYDDWRYLYPTPYSLVGGGWRWLGLVSNDTYYLTNQLLDYVVLRLSNISFFWLRAVALGWLAVQLVAQSRIVRRVTGTERLVGAVAVALGIWSLASGAYWGTTAIAYQQSLPTLFATLCLLCLITKDGSFNMRFSRVGIVVCCLAAGLAYISGGLLIFTLGLSCLLAAERIPSFWRDPAARAGFLLSAVGAALLVLQIALVWHQQGSLLAHNHASAPSVYPDDRRFWLFFSALFGRALGYSGHSPLIDLACAGITLAPGILLGIATLWPKFRGRVTTHSPVWTLLAIYAALGAATYAAIIAFGRAGFVNADADVQTIVITAKSRFHFWPIATMLPYAWLGWAQIVKRINTPTADILCACIAILMLIPKSPSVFDQTDYLRVVDMMTSAGAHCVVTHLADLDTNQPVTCSIMTGQDYDLAPTLRMLRARHSAVYQTLLEEGRFGR
jgi:hypothetical protein